MKKKEFTWLNRSFRLRRAIEGVVLSDGNLSSRPARNVGISENANRQKSMDGKN